MQTRAITPEDLAGSVIAVPPLCRQPDLSLAPDENANLIRHIEGGGVTTLLYGGNANLYNIGVSEYAALLDLLEGAAAAETLVIPSAGPYFGTMLEQAAILRGRGFPAAMVLPAFPSSPAGIQRAVAAFVEKSGVPAVLYMKEERYLTAEAAAELVGDGIIAWIKYAVVRDDPAEDALLARLVDLVDPRLIVSGIGEQPTIAHLRRFGLGGFTSGCVCVAPAKSMAVLRLLKAAQWEDAAAAIAEFRALEDLRNACGPIPVLHHAVAEAGIAETGPLYPLFADLPDDLRARIRAAATELM
ncbi:MAG: dihydrodipicolinate synthase family protein [Verrucomicrobiales bacterium]